MNHSENLNRLNSILNGRDLVYVDTHEGLSSIIQVNTPATVDDIEQINVYFKNKVPLEYISFLNSFNGAELFKVDDIAGFKFFSCDELIRINHFEKENLGEEWQDNIILFCSCLGDGDYVGFKVLNNNSHLILDCFIEEAPSQWKNAGMSFDSFLEKLIESRGEKFWLKK